MQDYLQIRELYHHGIKGQKWGIRRYQYADGSLTEEGRIRYNTEYAGEDIYRYTDNNGNTRYYYYDNNGNPKQYKTNVSDLDDDDKAKLLKTVKLENTINKEIQDAYGRPSQDAKDVLDSSARVLDATTKALPTGNGKYIKKDYSDISDQELRQRISRLQLEESYGRLSGDTKYVKSGSEKAREFLQTAGAFVAIGASVAALAGKIADANEHRRNRSETAHSDILEEELNSIEHHGIKGQKWGVRRWQEESGKLTPEGVERYRTNLARKESSKSSESYDKLTKQHQKEYIDYSKKQGAKRGAAIGAVAGIGIGLGRKALIDAKNISDSYNHPLRPYWKEGQIYSGGRQFVASWLFAAVKGGILGAIGGSIIGKHAGARSAKSHLAKRGKQYTDQLLKEPIKDLKKEIKERND